MERLFRFAERGESIGLIWAAMSEPLPMSAVAVEPSTVLMLDYEKALELTAQSPELRSHWNQKLAGSIRSHLIGDSKISDTSIVVVFHQSEQTRPLTKRLINRLSKAGETLGIFSDNEVHNYDDCTKVRSLYNNERLISEGEIHEQIGGWGNPARIIVDLKATIDDDVASRLIGLSQHILWVADESNWQEAIQRLRELEADSPAVRDKVAFIWNLRSGPTAPFAPEIASVAQRDIKTPADDSSSATNTLDPGVEGVIHHLRGISVGLALGGGAALGMAHLGVLRALEQAGVVVDRIAGTSAGAMVGLLCAAGHSPDYLVDRFTEDLQPGWLFRMLPRGGYWYLTYKYRRGKFDPMLRKYLNDLCIEQLPVPASAVTVDLVSGDVIVRNVGDAVHGILDSINLPLLSKPILRDGQALIDGGCVNNVPADVLVSQGCNLVIAVDVLAKIDKEFAGLRPDTPVSQGKPPNSVQTLLRAYAVQSYNMNSVGSLPADVRIEPDTSGFSMSEFTSASELASIGEQATREKLSTIQALLKRLGSTPHLDPV
ncbi:patatin-like phospholipase family protein [Bremerella sp. P1]|uniref:patatin-like phospholipase family protein n=1 Tax=Bremerella sp. P1 TaxID=3026424 RepID=UPI0023680C4E|nr:patatin-like phospholipase family protein [Bremerella sp. P1]WDI41995.1 patatin-like phospholipase family protein [Bremerella sp. P1]